MNVSKALEILDDGVDADPSGHRHERLKGGEGAGDPRGSVAFAHCRGSFRPFASDTEKGIHGQARAQAGRCSRKIIQLQSIV